MAEVLKRSFLRMKKCSSLMLGLLLLLVGMAHLNEAYLIVPNHHTSSKTTTTKRVLLSATKNSDNDVDKNKDIQKMTTTTTMTTTSRQDKVSSNNNKDNNNKNNKNHCLQSKLATVGLSLMLLMTSSASVPALASDYYSLSPEQKLVAEAWRTVDSVFLDRTFNNHADWFQMRQNLVYKTKYKSMQDAQDAISSLLSQLNDKYTKYLSPAKYQSLVDSATGTLAGVGVEIATNNQGQPIVSDVEPNSPAKQAGLQPNDIFIQVNGVTFDTNSSPDDVATQLRGPQGTKAAVTVQRGTNNNNDNNNNIVDFIISREPIKVTTVRSYMANKNIGVIRIKSFSGTTASTVAEQWQQLQSKNNNAKYLVLDLRSNPGGLLPGGVDTAKLFLPQNTPIVYVVSNKGIVDQQYSVTDGIDTSTPIAILVDHNTASAAEVFAAAMQDNGRAKLYGEPRTFGKGIIQTIRPLGDASGKDGGMAITIARYETPKHTDINKQGILVDQERDVSCPKDNVLSCLPQDLLSEFK